MFFLCNKVKRLLHIIAHEKFLPVNQQRGAIMAHETVREYPEKQGFVFFYECSIVRSIDQVTESISPASGLVDVFKYEQKNKIVLPD
jgi:hypothetical protein